MKKSGWAAIIGAVAAIIAASTPGMLAFLEDAGVRTDKSYAILAGQLNALQEEQEKTHEELEETKDWVRLLVTSQLGDFPEPPPPPRPHPPVPDPESVTEGAEEDEAAILPPVVRPRARPAQMQQMPLPRTLNEAMESQDR
jgi:hypothetical protein